VALELPLGTAFFFWASLPVDDPPGKSVAGEGRELDTSWMEVSTDLPERNEEELVQPFSAVVVELDRRSRDDSTDEGIGVIYVVAPVLFWHPLIVRFAEDI
jgi:hypothetical protein